MRKTIIITFSLLSAGFSCLSQEVVKALFIGNSYTYVNDLPEMIAQVALSFGDTLVHEQNTPGGYTFELHSQNTLTRNMINAIPWNYVVLQEQSQLPALHPDSVAVTTYPFADTLNRLILTNDSCTRTLFFMTWGRKNGDAQYCPTYPPVCTYEGMQARLRESYLTMGSLFDAPVSPVGVAWRITRNLYPGIELYDADGSHPGLHGSYLAACTFYGSMFHKSPAGAFVPPGILPSDAVILQEIARHAVFDSLDVWSIDTSRVHASFTAGQLSPSCFRFTNSSLNATHYLWDFGDAETSTETDPIHCYEIPGHYPVVLHAFSDCLADSASSGLVITGSGESLSDSQALLLFPNPTPGKLHIRYTGNDPAPCITVRNACGIAVALMTLTDNSCVLDLSGFSDGIYIVTGSDRQIPFSARFTIVR